MKPAIRAGTSVRALFALIGVCVAAFSPFLALLLRDRGFDPSQIGVVFSAMAATWMVANPVWGHAADVWIGRVRALRIAALGAATMGLVFFVPEQSLLVVLPVVIVLAAFHGAVVPIGDAIALDHLGPEDVRDYGLIRLWSSLAFAVAAIACGALYGVAGIGLMPLIYAVAMATLAAWSTTLVRDVPTRVPSGERFGSVGAAFRASPRLAPLLVGMLLWGIGFAAAWSFLPLRIVGRGGGPLLVGIAAASGAFVEVPVMRKSKWFTGRFSLRGVYVLGWVIYASVFVAWAFVKRPGRDRRLERLRRCRLRAPVRERRHGRREARPEAPPGDRPEHDADGGTGTRAGARGLDRRRRLRAIRPAGAVPRRGGQHAPRRDGDLVHAVAARVLGAERRARGPSRGRMTRSGCPRASPRRAPR